MAMRSELAELRANLDHLHGECLALKSELKFRALMRALKTFTPDDDHFNPDQPRDWHGRWTAVGGDASNEGNSAPSRDVGQVFSIFADVDSVPLGQRVAQFSGHDDETYPAAPQPAGATITYSTAVTGDERIDRTTERLTRTLQGVMDVLDFIPYSTPAVYGTAVHTAFGAAIKLQNLEGVAVEFSFKDNDKAIYGEEGSVRADVALRVPETGEVIAVYDLKTGKAVLRQSRADELRERFSASRSIPVIELHILRGSRIKHDPFSTHFWPHPETTARLDALR